MNLPFTHDQFLDLFAEYNRALWPALVALWIATAVAVGRLYLGSGTNSRAVALVLALHWAWSGAVYHLAYFRRINPAAMLFGVVFLIQAGLLVWRGVGRSQLTLQPKHSPWRFAAGALLLYSLLYPAVALLLGLRAPRFPSYGVPCPTTILTAGLLLLVPRREARVLGIIPVLWAVVGGSAAFLLQIRADLALPLAGLVLLGYMGLGDIHPAKPPDRQQHEPADHHHRDRQYDGQALHGLLAEAARVQPVHQRDGVVAQREHPRARDKS